MPNQWRAASKEREDRYSGQKKGRFADQYTVQPQALYAAQAHTDQDLYTAPRGKYHQALTSKARSADGTSL
ncbi:MAG: hypothetical protein NTNFB01_00540 [Nitrospira sp.]